MADDLFDGYIERRPRCRAVRLNPGNAWQVAEFLRGLGLSTSVNANHSVFMIEVSDATGTVLFQADANERDAVLYHADMSVSLVPGRDFVRLWEREVSYV